MVAYPGSQPVFVSPNAGDFLSLPSHSALHTQEDLENSLQRILNHSFEFEKYLLKKTKEESGE